MIFSNRDRNEEDGAKPTESHFGYLDRSGRPEAGRVRALIEGLVSEFPEDVRPELVDRLRTDDDISFLSAFSEIYFHALLRRFGYGVEVHPEAPAGGSRRPDFRATCEDGNELYIEVTMAADESASEAGARARMNVLLEAIDCIESPNFFLDLRLRGAPATPPSSRKLRERLSRWLSAQDPDALSDIYAANGWAGLPRLPYSHDGWRIDFVAVPKSPATRGRPNVRPIGSQLHLPTTVRPEVSIRKAVREKATRYGEFGCPYVVAVNLATRFAHRDTFEDALFGSLGITTTVDPADGAISSRETRERDGVWYGPNGPQNTRVSAVWAVNALQPWTVAHRECVVLHNPWALHALDPSRLPMAYGQLRGDRYMYEPGAAPPDIFGLERHWPEQQ